MTQDEQLAHTLYRFILTAFGETGKPPSLSEMAATLNMPRVDEVDRYLSMLETKDCIYRDPATSDILTAYPFSSAPTRHRVHIGEKSQVYAMCAVDALGMPFMLDTDATIYSECANCGKEVSVSIAAGKIVSASDGLTVVYTPPKSECCSATDQCPFINFFCSLAHAQGWQESHPNLIMKIWDLPEALAYGKTVFENLLRADNPTPFARRGKTG